MSPQYGEQIRKIRKAHNLTQVQLAEAAQIGITSLQRYEANERQPTMGALEKIAGAFGMSVSEFLWTDEKRAGIFFAKDMLGEEEYQRQHVNSLRENAIKNFDALNLTGKEKAHDYICDLAEQPKYTEE